MFIEKGYTRNFNFFIYLPIPVIFLGMLLLQFLVVNFLNLNIEDLMRQEIDSKGELRVFVEALAPLIIFFALLLLYVRFIHKQSLLTLTTARAKVDWNRIFFSFLLWGVLSAAMILAGYYASPQDYVLNFNLVPFVTMALLAVVLVPLQTSFEEYLFRGYLMQGIGIAAGNRWVPLLVTSILFGVMHASNPEIGKLGYILLLYYIGTGFFLGIITLMDDGLELSLGFHAANNLIAALLITSDWTVLQTPSILKDISEPHLGFEMVAPLLIFYPLLLLIFAKKYKWHSWKEKLTGKIILNKHSNL